MLRIVVALLLLTFCFHSKGQSAQASIKLAILDLGNGELAKQVTEKLRSGFAVQTQVQLINADLSGAAAKGIGYNGSLNMTVVEARDLGSAMDSEFYIIGDAQTVRRTSSETPVYFEAYASIFLISSRSGKLVLWERPQFQSDNAGSAEAQLIAHLSNNDQVKLFAEVLLKARADESRQRAIPLDLTAPLIEEAPDDERAAADQGLRLPRPYRRLRPMYPESAARAEAEATVDVLLDVRADGEVAQVQVARWAGFGLDESTVATVKQMHFFPAMRNGTAIPMRVLLRYNFRKPQR